MKKWIFRLKRGDQTAFLPFYEHTAPSLLRFLLWKTRGNKPLAEDILQETYVRVLLHVDSMEAESEEAIRSYLYRTVKNCLIDKTLRTRESTREHVALETMAELSLPQDASRAEHHVELRELNVILKSLDEKDSEIIWLRDVLGFSHREVATQVGISEEASRQAYVRAKRTLLAQMKDKWSEGALEGGGYAAAQLS